MQTPDKKGVFLLKILDFLKKYLYNTLDFAGGRKVNPINPTRPRYKKT